MATTTTTTVPAPWYVGQLPPATGSYAICPATQDDIARVVAWYQACPVPGSGIGSVQIIHNSQMARMFEGRVDLLEKRHGKAAFAPNWESESK